MCDFFFAVSKKSLFSGQADVGILSIRWPFKGLDILLSVWSMARQNKIFFIPTKTPLVLLMFPCCHSCPGVDRWKRGSQPASNGPLGPPPNIPLPFIHCEFHLCAVQSKKASENIHLAVDVHHWIIDFRAYERILSRHIMGSSDLTNHILESAEASDAVAFANYFIKEHT